MCVFVYTCALITLSKETEAEIFGCLSIVLGKSL